MKCDNHAPGQISVGYSYKATHINLFDFTRFYQLKLVSHVQNIDKKKDYYF